MYIRLLRRLLFSYLQHSQKIHFFLQRGHNINFASIDERKRWRGSLLSFLMLLYKAPSWFMKEKILPFEISNEVKSEVKQQETAPILNEPALFLHGAGNGNRTHLLSLEG